MEHAEIIKKKADELLNTIVKFPIATETSIKMIELPLKENKIVGGKCLSFFKDSTIVCDANCFLESLVKVVTSSEPEPTPQPIEAPTEEVKETTETTETVSA